MKPSIQLQIVRKYLLETLKTINESAEIYYDRPESVIFSVGGNFAVLYSMHQSDRIGVFYTPFNLRYNESISVMLNRYDIQSKLEEIYRLTVDPSSMI